MDAELARQAWVDKTLCSLASREFILLQSLLGTQPTGREPDSLGKAGHRQSAPGSAC